MENKQVVICAPEVTPDDRLQGATSEGGGTSMRGNQTALPQGCLGSAKNATHSMGLTVAACLGQDSYIPGCHSMSASKEGNTSPAPELL